MRRTRERYRVDLLELQAACEANYLRLMRLLPDMRNQPDIRRIAMSQGDRLLGVLVLKETVGPRRIAQRQRLCQTAGFVQLDVDHIVFAFQRSKARTVMTAFIGTDRHGPLHPDERIVIPCGQRLFNQ